MSPRFITALGDELCRSNGGVDLLLATESLHGNPALWETTAEEHPRVIRAHAHREHVRVFTDPTGAATLILGRGLADRNEVAIEIEPAHRNRGIARAALIDARRLVGPDQMLFAQTAPGNAASVRAFLAAGFIPIASEILFFPSRVPEPAIRGLSRTTSPAL